MTHETGHIIIDSLLHFWTKPLEYPGVRKHFSSNQLARIDGLAMQDEFGLFDKLFLARMVRKLLFTAV